VREVAVESVYDWRRVNIDNGFVREQKWPQEIWLVRHGQSAGNVARDEAEAAAGLLIQIAERDVDVPLSALGMRQSQALAGWFATLPPDRRPSVVLHSPYLRARQTAEIVMQSLDHDELLAVQVDERLREKEFGILDRLTTHGIRHKYPELSEQRQHVGKFYFRPPGGESWCDVILRLRSVLDTLTREYCRERVLIVAHQVIVNCFRYLFERLDEASILAADRAGDVPNCSVTSYQFDPSLGKRGKLALRLLNFVAPLEATGTPVTIGKDVPTAAKA
jgi:broad specificity phosphatase PhoE